MMLSPCDVVRYITIARNICRVRLCVIVASPVPAINPVIIADLLQIILADLVILKTAISDLNVRTTVCKCLQFCSCHNNLPFRRHLFGPPKNLLDIVAQDLHPSFFSVCALLFCRGASLFVTLFYHIIYDKSRGKFDFLNIFFMMAGKRGKGGNKGVFRVS